MRKLLAVAVAFVLGAVLSFSPDASAVVLVVSVDSSPEPANLSADDVAAWEASRVEAGDVISVKGDDWTLDDRRFGKRECKNHPPSNGGMFVCVDVPWLTRNEAFALTANVFFTNEKGDNDIKRFRRYRIALEDLAESAKNEAFFTGMVTLGDRRQVSILDKETR